jgi:hypothetical protein
MNHRATASSRDLAHGPRGAAARTLRATLMRIRNANCYEQVSRGHQIVLGVLLVPAKLYFGLLVALGIARLKRLT